MKRLWFLWLAVGRVLYIVCWPMLFAYMQIGSRTRVVIGCKGKVLVVKGWFGSGKWVLPGGGLHRGEDPILGAIREVAEETGIVLEPQSMQKVGDYRARRGMRYRYNLFKVELPEEPAVSIRGAEIVAAEWLDPAKLFDLRVSEAATYESLTIWRKP